MNMGQHCRQTLVLAVFLRGLAVPSLWGRVTAFTETRGGEVIALAGGTVCSYSELFTCFQAVKLELKIALSLSSKYTYSGYK